MTVQMTKSEIICQLHDIIIWTSALDTDEFESLDHETTKDLIDQLINFISLCQANLVK